MIKRNFLLWGPAPKGEGTIFRPYNLQIFIMQFFMASRKPSDPFSNNPNSLSCTLEGLLLCALDERETLRLKLEQSLASGWPSLKKVAEDKKFSL